MLIKELYVLNKLYIIIVMSIIFSFNYYYNSVFFNVIDVELTNELMKINMFYVIHNIW